MDRTVSLLIIGGELLVLVGLLVWRLSVRKRSASASPIVLITGLPGTAQQTPARKHVFAGLIHVHRSPADASWMRAHDDLPGLVRLMRYEDALHPVEAAGVRYAAAEALVGLDNLHAVEPLLQALSDPSSSVRAAAVRGLGALGHPQHPLGKAIASQRLRSRILSSLFPLVWRDPTNEVRWAAADAVYRVGGSAVLRPLLAIFRRRAQADPPNSRALADQRWFIQWAAGSHLYSLLVDVYPWFAPAARRDIVDILRAELTPRVLARLSIARVSQDPDLEELASAVLGVE